MPQIGAPVVVTGTTIVPAPHGLRAGAWAIDSVVIALVFAALPQPLPVLLLLLLLVAYHTVLLWLTQQTLGKALLGLRVVRAGKRPDFLWALGRSSLGYFAVDLFGAGVLFALFNPQRRTLHDVVFDSAVTVEETGRLTARNLLARFVAFCERQAEAVKARKEVAAALGAFWAFLLGLGTALKNAVDTVTRLLGGRPDAPAAQSILKTISTKAATIATTTATAATGVVFAAAPPARAVAEWLLEPRYFLVAPPTVTSTFDRDAEDWKITGDAQGASEDPSHADGAIGATDDRQGGTWYFEAPQPFLGNQLDMYGRDLVFTIKVDNTDTPYDDDDVILEGGDLTLVHDHDPPATDWTPYRVRLDETARWLRRDTRARATADDLRQALTDVRRLLLRGEYRSGADMAWLDEVTLGAVPVARIERIEAPESIVSGSTNPLTLTYGGDVRFPVRLIFRPRSCPAGFDCRTGQTVFATPSAGRRLVDPRFVWCRTTGPAWLMDFEVVLKDSAGTEIASPVSITCRPAP